jgi:hypothetical protein
MESRNVHVENAEGQLIVNIIRERKYVANAEETLYVNHMDLEKMYAVNVKEVLYAFIQK